MPRSKNSTRFATAVCLALLTITGSQAAEFRWAVPSGTSGDWLTFGNWTPPAGAGVPGLFSTFDEARIWNNGTADFDGTGQPDDTVSIWLVHMGTDAAQPPGTGDGFLNVTGGTLRVQANERDAVKIGTAADKTGGVVQTGGTVETTAGGFRIGGGRGDGNGSFNTLGEFGSYTISGGEMLAGSEVDVGALVDGSDAARAVRIVVGENDGNGELNIIGSGATRIETPDRFEVEANGRLNLTLDSGGITPITAGRPGSASEPLFDGSDALEGETGSDPGAMLNIDFSALSTTIGDILLIENRTAEDLIDRFTNAADDATLHTFGDGTSYKLSYSYEAGGDGFLNDLALIAVVPALPPGDYNDDGIVDAADYTLWRENVGTVGTLANDAIGGTIGQDHYMQWSDNLGATAGGSSLAVPEPSQIVLIACGLLTATVLRIRCRETVSTGAAITAPGARVLSVSKIEF